MSKNSIRNRKTLGYIIAAVIILAAIAGSANYLMNPQPTNTAPTTSLTPTLPTITTTQAPTATASGEKFSLNQKGSDTLLVLAQRWAEVYMGKHPEAQIAVSGGGSGTGIAALINKQIDFCDSSRSIKDQEISDAKKNGINPVEWKVAVDGIAVIVHPSNPIRTLTLTQLKGIYNGSYKNWENVGGKDSPILTYGRQSNSGTYLYWQEFILKNQNYRTDMQSLNGNSDIGDAVARDPNAIGYVGIAYAAARKGEVKVLPIQDKVDQPFYDPTSENIISFKYPISRYLFIYTNGVPTAGSKEYLKFIVGDDGQKVVEQVEYVPLPTEIRQTQAAMLQ
jgi:phosphate transport system substrate-binding protein